MQTTIWDARLKWFKLGVELGIKQEELTSIEVKYGSDDEICFVKMLSLWLLSPHPMWEGLLAALEQPAVGYMYSTIAEEIRLKLDVPAGVLINLLVNLETIIILKPFRLD